MTTSQDCSVVECEFCSIVNGELEGEEIYRDDKFVAVLHLKPAAAGHILLFTQHHYPILEQVPDFVAGEMFQVANKLSTTIFETLGPEGTNIIIENGVAAGQAIPHISVHIIPRRENDGLSKLQWTPKKVNNDEMDVVHYQIKEQAEKVHPSTFEHEAKKEVVKEEKVEVKKGNDYRLNQVRRRP